MKYTGIFFCIIFICCKSADKKNEALDAYKQNYKLILSAADRHPELAVNATQLYIAADSAIQFVEKLQDQLKQADKSGNDPSISTALLSRGEQGDQLMTILYYVYQQALACPLDIYTMHTMDSTLAEIKAIPVSINWTGAYFEETPSSTAIVLLEDIKNDLKYASERVMEDMARKAKE